MRHRQVQVGRGPESLVAIAADVAASVIDGVIRLVASLSLLGAAAGIGLLTVLAMMAIGIDIDYDDHPLQQRDADALAAHLIVALLCLLTMVIPVVEDRPPRRVWVGLIGLAATCLAGCVMVAATDMMPGTPLWQVGVVGALASAFCLARLATALRPAQTGV